MAKTRLGFISNSSSCSFIIKNKTTEYKDMEDFAKETMYLVHDFNEEYGADVTINSFMEGCKEYYTAWSPGEERVAVFGDEHGNDMGRVYDYMLRDGDHSKSFFWYFNEMLR